MLLVPTPFGPRNASDLRYVGEATSRPDPSTTSPEAWRDYLYLEHNPAGWLRETWYDRVNRVYFQVERNTATNEFRNPTMPVAKHGKKA